MQNSNFLGRFIANHLGTEEMSFEEALSARAVIITAYLAASVALFYTVTYFMSPVHGAKELAWLEVATFMGFISVPYLAKMRRLLQGKILLTFMAVNSIFLSVDARGSHSGEIFFYFPVLILVFIIFTEKDRRWVRFLMLYTFLGAGINLLAPEHLLMPHFDQNTPFDFGISFAAAGAISVIVTSHIRRKLSQSHQSLEKRTHDLMRSAQHAMVGEMAAGVAHEVNNPLSIISGKLHLLRRRLSRGQIPPEELAQEIEYLQKTCDRITQIVVGLKTVSRGENTVGFAPVDINQIVRESVWACSQRVKKCQADLRLQLENLPLVDCHAIKLSQVLVNLISNACDALEKDPNPWIEIQTCITGGFVEVCVIDAGRGIPSETAEKIFNAFYTTKPFGQGTGLGLSISKSIMREHGGDLVLDSNHPNTRFICRLPLKKVSAQPDQLRAA